MLTCEKDIINWLEKYKIKNYTINKDLSINVEGNVELSWKFLRNIPLKFNKINGAFDCSNNKLSNLEFCPQEIKGTFDCSNNLITSLKYCPISVKGSFFCEGNQLISLEYCPEKINGIFNCSHNKLTSLKYCTKDITVLNCRDNEINKDSLYIFNSNIKSNLFSDFGNKEEFLFLVREQKILHEKKIINNNLQSNENNKLVKKRL